jgi:3-deoxy-7-phosphoheptulonate synthase
MIILLNEAASPEERAAVAHQLIAAGVRGPLHSVHAALGDVFVVEESAVAAPARAAIVALPGVARLIAVETSYQLASRALQPAKTIVQVGAARIGGPEPVIIAGPCSVEGEREIHEAAEAARAAGAHLLRGGAFKPRTSPYAFQGPGLEGVALLARAGAAAGLPVVTEVMQPGMVGPVAEHADVLQVGSRNMQNFPLLRAVGQVGRPVLLKRGFAATIDEWLLAAEYILAEGNAQVILCERGIRGFDPHTRNVLDLACVPLLAQLTHLPVVVDPSHGTGHRALVAPLAVAAVAAGADGVMVEMHPQPDEALSDGAQTIDPATLALLAEQVHRVRASLREAPVAAER